MCIIYAANVEYMSVERIYQIAEWIVMYVNSVDAPTVDYLTGKIENKNI